MESSDQLSECMGAFLCLYILCKGKLLLRKKNFRNIDMSNCRHCHKFLRRNKSECECKEYPLYTTCCVLPIHSSCYSHYVLNTNNYLKCPLCKKLFEI